MGVVTEPVRYVPLDVGSQFWPDVYTVAPLVLVGTLEADGSPDVAPKHQATPIGHGPLFGFACSGAHATYRNAVATGTFTVGYPTAEMVLQASLAAAPRDAEGAKPTLDLLSLSPARTIEGVLVDGCRLQLECRMHDVLADLDDSVFVVGRVVAAYASERAMRVNGGQLTTSPPLAYLHPGKVTAVHDAKDFPYHRGFHA